MNELLLIVIGSVLVNNFVMSQFLGICPFLGVSKKTETALGMGMAVTFVMALASLITLSLIHILAAVENMLRQAKQLDEPVVIHCATKKGYGYNRAERRPEAFHGTPPFLVETGEVSGGSRQANGDVYKRQG